MAVPAAEELAALVAEAWEDISLPTSLAEARAAASAHIANGAHAAVVEVSEAGASAITKAARTIGAAGSTAIAFHDQVKGAWDEAKKEYVKIRDDVESLFPARQKKKQKKAANEVKRSHPMQMRPRQGIIHRRISTGVANYSQQSSNWTPTGINLNFGMSFLNLLCGI